MSLEGRMRRTLTELTDAMESDFDIADVLTTLADRSGQVLGVTAAGVMLAADDGRLQVMAWSSGAEPVIDLLQLQTRQGPCLDSFLGNRAVANQDLAAAGTNRRWPLFAPAARRAGFRGAHALPMHLGRHVVGVLGLLRYHSTPLEEAGLATAQALADVATTAVLRHGAASQGSHAVQAQLSQALHDRMIIEQAKGMIAERDGVSIDQAFARIRNRARVDRHHLVDVAADIVDGTLVPAALTPASR